MKTTININGKRLYCTPQIDRLRIDNDFALQLQSPMGEPGGSNWTKTDHTTPDPYNQA